MRKAKRLIEFCECYTALAVRNLLLQAKNAQFEVLSRSPNWQRIVNFSISNRLATFDNENRPLEIIEPPSALAVAEIIRAFCETKSDALDPFSASKSFNFDRFEPQPFLNVGQKVIIKNDWKHLFDEAHPQSLKRWLNNFFNISYRFLDADSLAEATITGKPQWARAFGPQVQAPFDLRNFKPELFFSLMAAMHQSNLDEATSLMRIFDSEPVEKLLDVGGATGALARVIAEKKPQCLVRVYEKDESLPIIQEIATNLNLATPANFSYTAGDFFRGQKFEGLYGLKSTDKFDFIILGWILHDWQDPLAIDILRRAAFHLKKPNGRVALLEKPLDADHLGTATKLDLTMLLQTGGKERSLQDYIQMASQVGLVFEKYVATEGRRDVILLRSEI